MLVLSLCVVIWLLSYGCYHLQLWSMRTSLSLLEIIIKRSFRSESYQLDRRFTLLVISIKERSMHAQSGGMPHTHVHMRGITCSRRLQNSKSYHFITNPETLLHLSLAHAVCSASHTASRVENLYDRSQDFNYKKKQLWFSDSIMHFKLRKGNWFWHRVRAWRIHSGVYCRMISSWLFLRGYGTFF